MVRIVILSALILLLLIMPKGRRESDAASVCSKSSGASWSGGKGGNKSIKGGAKSCKSEAMSAKSGNSVASGKGYGGVKRKRAARQEQLFSDRSQDAKKENA